MLLKIRYSGDMRQIGILREKYEYKIVINMRQLGKKHETVKKHEVVENISLWRYMRH